MTRARDCRGHLRNSVVWTRQGHCTLKLHAAVAAHASSAQAQTSLDPSTNCGCGGNNVGESVSSRMHTLFALSMLQKVCE